MHLGWEALLGEFFLVFSPCIHLKLFYLGQAAESQAFGIPKAIVAYIIHSVLMLRSRRACQPPFLIPFTEMILLLSILSPCVHKYKVQMWGICTRHSPSMDSMLFPPKLSQVRVVKWMWVISLTAVFLLLQSIWCMSYRGGVF